MLFVTIETVVLDDVGQLAFRYVRLDGPRPFGQVPFEQAGRARPAEHQTRIGQDIDQLLGADEKAAAGGALAQTRQQLEQASLFQP